jgi:uncharacterized protein (TIGR03083 family)
MTKTGETIDTTERWKLIHGERAALVDTLAGLSSAQWATKSLCAGWSVHVAAAHVLAGAEQTGPGFLKDMAANAFRFNTAMERTAQRLGKLPPEEIVERLRARVSTTNHPPAPIMAMLGEVVVHGEDIRRPLGISRDVAPDAIRACLTMYAGASFPVGAKKRMRGLKVTASDVGWSFGSGPEVSGPGMAVLLVMTGRSRGLDDLQGAGLDDLRARMA